MSAQRDCIHGHLARSCELCAAQNDHATACEQIERLRAELAAVRADAEIGQRWNRDSSLETWFPYTAEELTRLRAELAAALVDAERYRELRRLATTWPTTVLVVNYNIGHTWHTADAPDEIDGVLDDAIAARGHA